MSNFNYKNYSLSKLREWISDSLSCGEESAQDIYETILSETEDLAVYHKQQYENAMKLQNLMKGHRPTKSLNEVYESKVEEDIITGEQWITFPPELINKLGWKEGDELEWIDNHDGTFTIQKV